MKCPHSVLISKSLLTKHFHFNENQFKKIKEWQPYAKTTFCLQFMNLNRFGANIGGVGKHGVNSENSGTKYSANSSGAASHKLPVSASLRYSSNNRLAYFQNFLWQLIFLCLERMVWVFLAHCGCLGSKKTTCHKPVNKHCGSLYTACLWWNFKNLQNSNGQRRNITF